CGPCGASSGCVIPVLLESVHATTNRATRNSGKERCIIPPPAGEMVRAPTSCSARRADQLSETRVGAQLTPPAALAFSESLAMLRPQGRVFFDQDMRMRES